jgi:ABC-type lipoprotein release transport system permease subunit
VAPSDPTTLIATASVLALVALVASWLPARRAAAVPPTTAMRVE